MSTSPEQDSGFLVSDQSDVLRLLAEPGTYADAYAPGGTVDEIRTHASAVFLCGDWAFKLKRAVKFPYLDYSTLSLREIACRDEVRLNRRTAPDLYVGVAPIDKTVDGHCLGEPGRPGGANTVEWVVVMKRFEEATRFDRLASAGQLTEEVLDRLARIVADFHDRAHESTIPYGRSPADAARDVLSTGVRELERSGLIARNRLEEMRAAYAGAIDRLAPVMERRAAAGNVRHCHGDLHLRNICLVAGVPTPFDCIEFEPAFSETDVLYDLAFLLMDLIMQGPAGSANLIVCRYLEARPDDIAGLSVMPLFTGLRALIRAHVLASGALLQPDAEMAAETRLEAKTYFDLACRALVSSEPLLIAVGGASGSGKSTLARRLAPAIGGIAGALVLRTDAIRKRHWGAAPLEQLPSGAYTSSVSRAVYADIENNARLALAAGETVILDATFTHPESRIRVKDLAAQAGTAFVGIWLDAPNEILTRRVTERQGDVSDADADVVALQLSQDWGTIGWTRLSAADGIDAVESRARQVLAGLAGAGTP